MKSLAVNHGVEKDARYTRTSHPNRSAGNECKGSKNG